MEGSIAVAQSPFRALGKRELEGVTVYELQGLGQRHFYFQAGRLLIWLASDDDVADQALSETLAFYSR